MSTYKVTQLARIDFRNDHDVFGIKTEDRFSHTYIIGKTGTGKSTLIETMVLQDLEHRNGFALIEWNTFCAMSCWLFWSSPMRHCMMFFNY